MWTLYRIHDFPDENYRLRKLAVQPVSDTQHWDQVEELLKGAVKDLPNAEFPDNIPEVLALLSAE